MNSGEIIFFFCRLTHSLSLPFNYGALGRAETTMTSEKRRRKTRYDEREIILVTGKRGGLPPLAQPTSEKQPPISNLEYFVRRMHASNTLFLTRTRTFPISPLRSSTYSIAARLFFQNGKFPKPRAGMGNFFENGRESWNEKFFISAVLSRKK